MPKINLRIEEIGSIEIDVKDPKFLASFLSWLAEMYQPQLEPVNKPAIHIKSLETDVSPQEKVESVLHTTDKLPSVNEVTNYILQKEDYAHNTVELMDKFIGRRAKSNEEPKLYGSFNNIVRKARKQIEQKHHIEWDTSERTSYDSGTHPIVYKIKKSTVQHTQVASNSPSQVDNQSGEDDSQKEDKDVDIIESGEAGNSHDANNL